MYKVVCKREDGKYTSCRILKGHFCLKYGTDFWTEAPLNGCLVFESKKYAFSFVEKQKYDFPKTRGRLFVFEAMCEEEVDSCFAIYANEVEISNSVEEFISYSPYAIFFPNGTKAFKRVKLVKEVSQDED